MPRRFVRCSRQFSTPSYPSPRPTWGPDHRLQASQTALTMDFGRLGMDDSDDEQLTRTRTQRQPDYSKKDFRRAAEDLHSCLHEALEFFPKLLAEFACETKEIKKYGDADLLNIIWEKKILRLENGPRAVYLNGNTTSSPKGGRQRQQFGRNDPQDERQSYNDHNSCTAGIKSFQHRIVATIEAMLDCRRPQPIDDDEGVQIRIEEIRDFEERISKAADRVSESLRNITYDFQALRRVIRDLTTMLQDLNLFPLKLWKAGEDEQEQGHDEQELEQSYG